MQFIAEFLTAIVVWIAAAVLSQFGVEVELERHAPPAVERVVERAAAQDARTLSEACPEQAAKARKAPLAAV